MGSVPTDATAFIAEADILEAAAGGEHDHAIGVSDETAVRSGDDTCIGSSTRWFGKDSGAPGEKRYRFEDLLVGHPEVHTVGLDNSGHGLDAVPRQVSTDRIGEGRSSDRWLGEHVLGVLESLDEVIAPCSLDTEDAR